MGGPVSPQTIVLLHRSSSRLHFGETTVCGKLRFVADLDAVAAALENGAAKPEEYRLFMGYAGWAPQQLQGECDENTWLVAEGEEAAAELAMAPVPAGGHGMRDHLWAGALQKLGGEHAHFAQLAAVGTEMAHEVREELWHRALGIGVCENAVKPIVITVPEQEQEASEDHADDV